MDPTFINNIVNTTTTTSSWINNHLQNITMTTHDMLQHYHHHHHHHGDEEEELGAMKEMMYKIAVMQPVDIDPAAIRKPRRRNVRISHDPQSVAARLRRDRIGEKIRILRHLVPGGTKLDTASMLDEAIHYVKFLKRQIRLLQPTQQPQYSNIFTTSTAVTTTVTTDWPFAPNILQNPTATVEDTAAGIGFDGDNGGNGFNHNEVISE